MPGHFSDPGPRTRKDATIALNRREFLRTASLGAGALVAVRHARRPGEKTDVSAAHPDAVAELRKAYEQWWSEVLPCLVNENVPMAREPAFHVYFRRQLGAAQEAADRAGAARSARVGQPAEE